MRIWACRSSSTRARPFPRTAALDQFESVEGLSGSRFNDILMGTNDTAVEMGPIPAGGAGGFLGSYLDAEGIALINGLQDLLGAGVTAFQQWRHHPRRRRQRHHHGSGRRRHDRRRQVAGRADRCLRRQRCGPHGTPIALHNSMASLTRRCSPAPSIPASWRSSVRSATATISRIATGSPMSMLRCSPVRWQITTSPSIPMGPSPWLTRWDRRHGYAPEHRAAAVPRHETSGVVVGTAAAETLNGTAGINDTFVFTSAAAANGDTILTFEAGDRVDLTAIDANLGAAGDQSFTLINGAFTAGRSARVYVRRWCQRHRCPGRHRR